MSLRQFTRTLAELKIILNKNYESLLYPMFYCFVLVASDSPLDGMTRIDDGTSPDCLISKSLAASLAAASLLSRSESAFSTLHPDSARQDQKLIQTSIRSESNSGRCWKIYTVA